MSRYPMAKINGARGQNNSGWCNEHTAMADRALGRPCPPGVVVHHYNGKADHLSLVICENQGYHMLLERRTRALDACGNANWRKCEYCKLYDAPESLTIDDRGVRGGRVRTRAYHRSCAAARMRARRQRGTFPPDERRKGPRSLP